jgi:DNA-binding beta-propeller fold protein YncE
MENRIVVLIMFLLVGVLSACQSQTRVPASATIPPTPLFAPTAPKAPTRTLVPATATNPPTATLTQSPPNQPTPLPAEFVWKIDGEPNPFKAPVGIALDPVGNFYVMDTKNARVQKFDSSGKFLLMWGSPGAGKGQFSITVPDEGRLAVDTHGNLYVLDVSNYRIQKFDSQGNFLIQWGSKGEGEDQFLEAADIAIDGQNHVYVGDYKTNFVQKFDENGKLLLRWGSSKQFSGIYSVALDPDGNVLVTDERNTLRKFDSNGNLLSEIPPLRLNNLRIELWNIAVDGKGNVYIADHAAYRIVIIDPQGKVLATWRGRETGAASFNSLQDIAVDGQGNIYITDSGANLVQKFQLLELEP